MFDTSDQSSLASCEEKVLQFWKKNAIFKRSLEQTKAGKRFTFYDGPPFATGYPHYGHLLAGTIKDVVPRYKTMQGFYVERRFGWDCHGLPIENEIEKDLNLSGAPAIEAYGIAKFNEDCNTFRIFAFNVSFVTTDTSLVLPYLPLDITLALIIPSRSNSAITSLTVMF
jgi:isoleucyl-tRNA synthetase